MRKTDYDFIMKNTPPDEKLHEENTCKHGYVSAFWQTTCGKVIQQYDHTWKYCPYCGGRIVR